MVRHRGRCSCGWVGEWTESATDAADAAYFHHSVEECDGDRTIEVAWPMLVKADPTTPVLRKAV